MATTRTQVAAVIAGQQLVAFDQQYAGITEHTVQLVRQHVEAGESAPLELDRAQIDHQRARAALVAAEHDLLQAKLALLQTMGRPDASTAWSAVGNLPPKWHIPNDELSLLELASTGRLDVAAAGQRVLRAAADLGLADTGRYPEVAAMVTWQQNFGDREAIVPGAQITLPILDNGDPAIAMNTAKLEAARLDLLGAQEAAIAEVRTDLSRLRNARMQVSILRNDQLVAAVRAFERSEAAWEAGEVNLNTLLDTQRRRIQVEHELVQQSFTVMQAMCSLRKAVGGSFDADLDRIPEFDVQRDPSTPAFKESSS
jgi:outer membrane protein TolC